METVPADIAQLVYEERLLHAHLELLHPRNHPDIEPVVTLEQCLKDVEKALRSKSLPLHIARAMKAIRQRKIESLMKQFG